MVVVGRVALEFHLLVLIHRLRVVNVVHRLHLKALISDLVARLPCER